MKKIVINKELGLLHIYVDADACPAKEEIYKVASRNGLHVTLVANSWMRTPDETWLKLEVVGNDFDEADNWIVDKVQENDIVITGDILLASRCLKEGAAAINPDGKIFDDESIGQAVAMRDLMEELRMSGDIMGGPAPRQKRDRSNFLQQFEELIRAVRRDNPSI